MFLYYFFFIKLVFFYSLVHALVKFEPMKNHYIFLGVIYTLGSAFLAYIFQMSIGGSFDWNWAIQTLLISTIYFWLLAKFDEGVIFWTLLLLGFLVVRF